MGKNKADENKCQGFFGALLVRFDVYDNREKSYKSLSSKEMGD